MIDAETRQQIAAVLGVLLATATLVAPPVAVAPNSDGGGSLIGDAGAILVTPCAVDEAFAEFLETNSTDCDETAPPTPEEVKDRQDAVTGKTIKSWAAYSGVSSSETGRIATDVASQTSELCFREGFGTLANEYDANATESDAIDAARSDIADCIAEQQVKLAPVASTLGRNIQAVEIATENNSQHAMVLTGDSTVENPKNQSANVDVGEQSWRLVNGTSVTVVYPTAGAQTAGVQIRVKNTSRNERGETVIEYGRLNANCGTDPDCGGYPIYQNLGNGNETGAWNRFELANKRAQENWDGVGSDLWQALEDDIISPDQLRACSGELDGSFGDDTADQRNWLACTGAGVSSSNSTAGDSSADPCNVDTDGNGVSNCEDSDIDGDGTPNDEDPDDDGDGIGDGSDPRPQVPSNPDPSTVDTDGDGVTNDEDKDTDGDGVPDDEDPDDDGDGIPDDEDPDPKVPNENEGSTYLVATVETEERGLVQNESGVVMGQCLGKDDGPFGGGPVVNGETYNATGCDLYWSPLDPTKTTLTIVNGSEITILDIRNANGSSIDSTPVIEGRDSVGDWGDGDAGKRIIRHAIQVDIMSGLPDIRDDLFGSGGGAVGSTALIALAAIAALLLLGGGS
jgi:hypothetical protein